MKGGLDGEISATRWIEDIRQAQRALDGIEMDERVRRTVARCLSAEFLEAVGRFEDLTMHQNDGKKWTVEDDEVIRVYLADKPRPPDWRTEGSDHWAARRVLAVELAFKLLRSEKGVEKRATALGFRHFS